VNRVRNESRQAEPGATAARDADSRIVVMARRVVDFEAVRERVCGRCFICELLAGRPIYDTRVVYKDDIAIAFLNDFPPLYGYVLVASRKHREQVTGDFTVEKYVDLQRVVHKVGEAIRRIVPTERLYVLSLGSQQGNSHVHWHLAPLPPNIPFDEQQLAALDTDDCLVMTEHESDELAARLREALDDGVRG
jgi:diadenosine tetraphosphate (Ap4A) HIT family hydrolase